MDFNTFIGIFHPSDETAVGADLSRPPPPCISHKRRIAETWRNAFQVPIYRPKGGSKILGLICSSSLSAQIDINLSALTISPFASLRACLLLPTVTHSLRSEPALTGIRHDRPVLPTAHRPDRKSVV